MLPLSSLVLCTPLSGTPEITPTHLPLIPASPSSVQTISPRAGAAFLLCPCAELGRCLPASRRGREKRQGALTKQSLPQVTESLQGLRAGQVEGGLATFRYDDFKGPGTFRVLSPVH